MTENTNMTKVDDVTSSRGAQWAGAGSLIALAAQSLVGNGGNGILGNILGGGQRPPNGNDDAITALMVENAKLKADARTDEKVFGVTELIYQKDKAQDLALYNLDKRVSEIEVAAPLREQIVLNKIDCVANAAQCGIAQNSTAITNLQNLVNGFTRTVIPNSACCPGWGDVTITTSTSAS